MCCNRWPISLRKRVREKLEASGPGRMHLKNDAGGVADVEFMVQYLVLAHAASASELVLIVRT